MLFPNPFLSWLANKQVIVIPKSCNSSGLCTFHTSAIQLRNKLGKEARCIDKLSNSRKCLLKNIFVHNLLANHFSIMSQNILACNNIYDNALTFFKKDF